MINNIFYLHTKPVNAGTLENRATIACKVVNKNTSDGKEYITYGISICSDSDNFSRKVGRELSTKRMNSGFGAIERNKGIYAQLSDEDALTHFATQLARAVRNKFNRYKRKVERYNSNYKEVAKTTI